VAVLAIQRRAALGVVQVMAESRRSIVETELALPPGMAAPEAQAVMYSPTT